MVGKAIPILLTILFSVSLLFLSSGASADHPNHPGTPNDLDLHYGIYHTVAGTKVSPVTANSNPDGHAVLNINIPDANFAKIISQTAAPEWGKIAMSGDITLGAKVGEITNITTLSLLHSPCNQKVQVDIPFLNCSTDTSDTIAWDPEGGHARDKSPVNDIPDYCDHYPEWLLDIVDPDGAGPLPGMVPRARYAGHTLATDGSPPTLLQFLVFNPEQLSMMPRPEKDFGDTLGYTNFVVLDNPGAEVAVSPITDFCTPLVTDTNLYGRSGGVMAIADDETVPDGTLLPFEWIMGGECDGDDDDGDGVIDDGCFTEGTATNEERSKTPAANTGIYVDGTTQTSSHLAGSYMQGQRDIDWDGIGNNIDPCPLHADNDDDATDDNLFQKSSPYDTKPWDPWLAYNHADNEGDGDNDGLPDACDPVPGTKNDDQDGDGFKNRQDNCPLVSNPLQLDEDWPSGSETPDIGPRDDGIGDACEPDFNGDGDVLLADGECKTLTDCTTTQSDWVLDPDRPDGDFFKDMVRGSECVGGTDSDGDGWCDATENALGSDAGTGETPTTPENPENIREWYDDWCPSPYTTIRCQVFTCSDGEDNDGDGNTDDDDAGCSVPEHISIDVDIDPVQQSCSDGVDNDQDGYTDSEELDGPDAGSDADCGPITGDTDDDGMPDGSDNCKYCKNPEQLNTDAAGTGDACDTDDDGDGWFDPAEWQKGTDPKDNTSTPSGSTSDDTDADGFTDNAELFIGTDPTDDCRDDADDAAWPLDMNNDGIAKINDVLFYAGNLKANACQAGYDRRLDLNADAIVKINDVLFFAGHLKETC